MTTKIFVSQIDTTQPDGTTAAADSVLVLTGTGPKWVPVGELSSNGYKGSAGFTGSAGNTGFRGSSGDGGIAGAPGDVGYKGSAGSDGAVGYRGSAGAIGVGYFGSVGYIGSAGIVGYMGSSGASNIGYNGSVGYRGSAGSKGLDGEVGYMGSAGSVDVSFLLLSDIANRYTDYNDYAGAWLKVSEERDGLVFYNEEVVLTANVQTDVKFNGKLIINSVLDGYAEIVTVVETAPATVTINPLTDSNIYTMTLDESVTAIILDNTGLETDRLYGITMFIKQGSGGNKTIDWSQTPTLYWSTGDGIDQNTGPSLSPGESYTDVITVYTLDGGSTWFGVMGARGYPTP
jgi:hypothetical protein